MKNLFDGSHVDWFDEEFVSARCEQLLCQFVTEVYIEDDIGLLFQRLLCTDSLSEIYYFILVATCFDHDYLIELLVLAQYLCKSFISQVNLMVVIWLLSQYSFDLQVNGDSTEIIGIYCENPLLCLLLPLINQLW